MFGSDGAHRCRCVRTHVLHLTGGGWRVDHPGLPLVSCLHQRGHNILGVGVDKLRPCLPQRVHYEVYKCYLMQGLGVETRARVRSGDQLPPHPPHSLTVKTHLTLLNADIPVPQGVDRDPQSPLLITLLVRLLHYSARPLAGYVEWFGLVAKVSTVE